MRRFPLAPLLEVTGLTMAQLNARIRMGGDTYRRVQTEGLSELVADRWATRLGLHPAEVWTDWFDQPRVECAERDCTETFVPTRKGHRFCSTRCQTRNANRAYSKRRWANDPKWRARKAAASRRYNEEAARAVLARKRARYQERADELRAQRRARYAQNPERWRAYQAEYRRRRAA